MIDVGVIFFALMVLAMILNCIVLYVEEKKKEVKKNVSRREKYRKLFEYAGKL